MVSINFENLLNGKNRKRNLANIKKPTKNSIIENTKRWIRRWVFGVKLYHLTHTLKSHSMLKWGLIIACKWVFNGCVRRCILSTHTDTSKTLHQSQIWRLVFSVIEAYDQKNFLYLHYNEARFILQACNSSCVYK